MSKVIPDRGARWAVIGMRALCVLLLVMGAFFAWFGTRLVLAGGSAYYVLSGVVVLAAAVLLWRRRPGGAWLYLAWVAVTLVWALAESGTSFWMLFPRIFVPLATGMLVAWLAPCVRQGGFPRKAGFALGAVMALGVVGMFANLFVRHDPVPFAGPRASTAAPVAASAAAGGNWSQYGGSGLRRSNVPYAQITPANVKDLKVAWTFRTGDVASNGAEDQNTPLQVGDTLYVCTPHDKVFALDADDGKPRWTFDAQASAPIWQRCRSLAYADMAKNSLASTTTQVPAQAAAPAPVACPHRLYMGTIDARLIALDADTGKPCEGFGKEGQVDLHDGMGPIKPSFYMQTSGPTVVENGLVVIAGWVWDNESVGEPSGVVRAFDAITGTLVWAWDLGNPAITGEPPPGQTYTRGTPNMWAFPAVDERLGLIYLPLGNATPDYWGGERSAASDAYNSSVVALDYRTGKERWKFQTTHHDIWDYDLPTHPVLYDIPDGKGGTLPALLQATKRGEIFMLDRRDGTPLAQVEEKPVPTDGVAAGDRLSPTQPYSVGMPSIRIPSLSEKDMWGMTPLDQLWCRVAFHAYRYEGDFTPQSTRGIIQYPSNLGGMNWGGMSVDETHHYLVINDSRVIMVPQLIPRSEAGKYAGEGGNGHIGYSAQAGTPFGVTTNYFLSPLGVPCNTPPLGTLTAVDLQTRKIVWQVPLGTASDTGPAGIKTHLPMQVGMPSLGAALATGSGLSFYSGTQDYYLRAFDSATGQELWKGRLPVGGQSTPMSYVSPDSHRQYVVVTASGARGSVDRGDYVVAYALPADGQPSGP